jgi:hypothetical protein
MQACVNEPPPLFFKFSFLAPVPSLSWQRIVFHNEIERKCSAFLHLISHLRPHDRQRLRRGYRHFQRVSAVLWFCRVLLHPCPAEHNSSVSFELSDVKRRCSLPRQARDKTMRTWQNKRTTLFGAPNIVAVRPPVSGPSSAPRCHASKQGDHLKICETTRLF